MGQLGCRSPVTPESDAILFILNGIRRESFHERRVGGKTWEGQLCAQSLNVPAHRYYIKFRETWPILHGMPNLYFCQPHAKNQGMLRAVLSTEECDRVIGSKSVIYVGEQFPAPVNDAADSQDFAVLRVAPGETSRRWRSGYYRSNSDLADLNEALRKLER